MNFDSGSAFLAWPNKRLAFIGMSGVGKSTLASYLNPHVWTQFCTDYLIADGPLRQQLSASVGPDYACSPQDISALTAYIGKLGTPAQGGLALDEFRRRQQAYGLAERQTFEDLSATLAAHQGPAILDVGGSLVEILDFDRPDPLRTALLTQVFFVYIETTELQTQALIDRHFVSPKPMFYQSAFLTAALAAFARPIEQVAPDAFIRYVFPRLVAHRRPKYEALARQGGVSLPLDRANQVRSDQELLDVIAEAIDHAH